MPKFHYTIQDLLERPSLKDAKVVAGQQGLDRLVKWVHILEVTDIGQLLNGYEMILTTGVGWKEDNDLGLSILTQLIESNVSGLCIELGKYMTHMSKDMLDMANRHQFPIIVFQKEVRFIDITQDINTALMSRHYKMIADLEMYSKQLNQLLLKPSAFKHILRLLHDYLGVVVFYLPRNSEESILLTTHYHITKHDLLMKMEKDHQQGGFLSIAQGVSPDKSYARQTIRALGHDFADVIIYTDSKPLGEFESLVLDRSTTAMSQDLLRMVYIEEKRKHQQQQWVREWLNGDHEAEDVLRQLRHLDPTITAKVCFVCIYEPDLSDDSSMIYYTALFRTIFSQQGFYLISTYDTSQFVFCLIDQRGKETWKKRMDKAIEGIGKIESVSKESKPLSMLGVGMYCSHIDRISESYRSAKETIQIKSNTPFIKDIYYDQLHAYRLVYMLKKHSNIHQFIDEYLGELIRYDRLHHSHLLETLQVFLETNGSKKQTASKLFIVRQTMYHRLDKIKGILGDDFMEPSKRIAIEVAILAHHYR